MNPQPGRRIDPESLAEIAESLPEPQPIEFANLELRIVHRTGRTVARVAGITREESRRPRSPGDRPHVAEVVVQPELVATLEALLTEGANLLAQDEADTRWQNAVAAELRRRISRPASEGPRR